MIYERKRWDIYLYEDNGGPNGTHRRHWTASDTDHLGPCYTETCTCANFPTQQEALAHAYSVMARERLRDRLV